MKESPARRILIMGAAGCGCTTLGQSLSQTLNWPFADSDQYFWLPTDPPYLIPRSDEERAALIQNDLTHHPRILLAGSFAGWADQVMPHLDLVIFLSASWETRKTRIIERETRRWGLDTIQSGGAEHLKFSNFLAWAEAYDRGGVSRTRALHEDWLKRLGCPVIRIDAEQDVSEIALQALGAIRTLNVKTSPSETSEKPYLKF